MCTLPIPRHRPTLHDALHEHERTVATRDGAPPNDGPPAWTRPLDAPQCCEEPAQLHVVVGLGQRHITWRCAVCDRWIGAPVSRQAVRRLGLDPDQLPARLSAARERAATEPRLF